MQLAVYNGFARPIQVTLDGESFTLAPEDALRVSQVPGGTVLEAASRGGPLDRQVLPEAPEGVLVVWNVAGRGMLWLGVARYGEGEAPEHEPLPGQPLLLLEGIDHAFEDPPEQLDVEEGASVDRSVLYGQEDLDLLHFTMQLRSVGELERALTMLEAELRMWPGRQALLDHADLLCFDLPDRLAELQQRWAALGLLRG
jgi:hypothetical protein